MTRLSFRFAKRKSTAQCLWALRFACCVLAAAVSVEIPAEERVTGAVVSLDHSAADLKVPPDAGVIPVPGTDPIRITVITFALPRDNLLIAEATKLALAPLFPNRGIKLIFCTFEEFDRIVLMPRSRVHSRHFRRGHTAFNLWPSSACHAGFQGRPGSQPQ